MHPAHSFSSYIRCPSAFRWPLFARLLPHSLPVDTRLCISKVGVQTKAIIRINIKYKDQHQGIQSCPVGLTLSREQSRRHRIALHSVTVHSRRRVDIPLPNTTR